MSMTTQRWAKHVVVLDDLKMSLDLERRCLWLPDGSDLADNCWWPWSVCHQSYFLLDFWTVTYLPHKEAEEAEQCVHESDIVGDAGDDCLLTVRTHSLHRWGLEHFPLQYGHRGRCSWRSQDGRCVTSHVDKVTGTRTHLSCHRVRKVTGRRWVGATCTEGKNA